jgi:pyrroline-5-carboxylate reductase
MEEEILKELFNKKIGFIGLGQMGTALLTAFIEFLKKNSISQFRDIFYLCEREEIKNKELKQLGFKNVNSDEETIFTNCKIIFLCVKPDGIQGVLSRNISSIDNETLLISIAAGISLEFMHQATKKKVKIVRIMTNHLCSIFEAASVYSVNAYCSEIDEKIVKMLLKNMGTIKKIEEKQMNIFTSLSGSGPAFVYNFIESLSDAALKNGVDIQTSREYAIQVVYGAAKYMKMQENKNPNIIKYIVTTPNGTTIAGLSQLDKHKFKWAVSEAITHATKRAEEIEKEKMRIFAKTNF